MTKVLDYLDFREGIQFFKEETKKGMEHKAKDAIASFLEGRTSDISGLDLSAPTKKSLQRRWQLKKKDERRILMDVLPRIDLRKDQIEKILADGREAHGISANLGEIIENPYALSEQFVGDDPDDRITFNKIDHGAFPSPDLGLSPLCEKDDWRRLRGLCVERLQKESKHTFVAQSQVLQDVNHKLSLSPEWKRVQFSDEYFSVDKDELEQALTMRTEKERKYLYLKSVFEDERLVEKDIRSLAKRNAITFRTPVTEKHWRGYLYESDSPLAQRNPSEYENAIEGQIRVCQKIFSSAVCVISGAAGTGKTTVISAVIKSIEKAHGGGTAFQLLAPTGKAADRMRERTGIQSASTIHSFLAQKGWLNDNLTFKRSGGSLEEGTSTFIIDESSMLDLQLVSALFRAINWTSVQRLILVGDPNQLPPIGRGRVFADIIDYLEDAETGGVGVLNVNMRQMENRVENKGTGILEIASLYLRERHLDAESPENKAAAEESLRKLQEGGEIDKDLQILYWKDAEDLKRKLLESIIEEIEKDTGGKFSKDRPYKLFGKANRSPDGTNRPHYWQIMSPYRGELFGTDNLNMVLQTIVNGYSAKQKGTLGGITIFDKVIQFRNRPRSNPYWAYNCETRKKERVEVFNGELGFTKPHAFDKNWKWDQFRITRMQAVFARKEKYWIDILKDSDVEENLELAYAISVHKAQGSEFERVWFVLPKRKTSLLSTELLYTGVTRAQNHLTILAEEDVSTFLSLRRREKSHLLAINSSLFSFAPVPDELIDLSWYEEGKILHTLSEYLVRSKSEVIIANMLSERNIPFRYEVPLFAPDGTFYLPDFTITWNGEKWYWEHLGRLDIPEYKKHWDIKKSWYSKHFGERLVTTSESARLSTEAKDLIEQYFS